MYQQAWQRIQESTYITLISHLNPDGDTLGSALALYPALKQMGKKVTLVNLTPELPRVLDFLPHFDKIRNKMPEKTELLIAFDCGALHRLGLETKTHFTINIDHHVSNNNYGDINIIEMDQPSATMVVYKLLKENGISISKDQATCIYTGLATDSGFFQFESTTQDTFRIAADLVEKGANPHNISQMLNQRESLAKIRLTGKILDTLELHQNGRVAIMHCSQEMLKTCGAQPTDTEHIANLGRTLTTVEASLFLREESPEEIKISLRSKDYINVSEIAAAFGGGGHIRAAGCNFKGKEHTIESIKGNILNALTKQLKTPSS